MPEYKTSALARWSFYLGLLGLTEILFILPDELGFVDLPFRTLEPTYTIIMFHLPLSIIGIVLGIIALLRIQKDNGLKGKGLAIAGIALNSVFILLYMSVAVMAFTQREPGVPEPDIPATADERILLPSDELYPTMNREFTFTVNVYNADFDTTAKVTGTLDCKKSTDISDQGNTLTATSNSQTIPPGEDTEFKFTIPKSDLKYAWTRNCTLTVSDGTHEEVKMIVVNVK